MVENSLNDLASTIYVLLLQNNNINNGDTSITSSVGGSDYNGTGVDIGKLTDQAYQEVFGLAFVYYLFCAGLILIGLGIFRRMILSQADVFDYIAIAVRIIVGCFLCFLNFMQLQPSGQLVADYAQSGAFLPTFLFALLLGK